MTDSDRDRIECVSCLCARHIVEDVCPTFAVTQGEITHAVRDRQQRGRISKAH